MARVLSVLLLCSFFIGGCVPLSTHGALREAYNKLEAEDQAVKKELAQTLAESKRLQQEAASLKAANETLTRQVQEITANLQQLNREKAGLAEQAASAQAALAAKEAEKTALVVKAEEQAIALRRMEEAKTAAAAPETEKTARAVQAEEQKITLQRRVAAKAPPPAVVPVVVPAQEQQPIRSLEDALKDELVDGSASIRRGENTLTIELLEPILYYNAASATVTPAGLKVLKRIAGVLKEGDDKEIRIEAYTDVAIHTSRFPSNMDLTIARANGVLRFLRTQNVAPQTRLSAVGYADSQPASEDDAREARNRNRRVEIVVTPAQRPSVSGPR